MKNPRLSILTVVRAHPWLWVPIAVMALSLGALSLSVMQALWQRANVRSSLETTLADGELDVSVKVGSVESTDRPTLDSGRDAQETSLRTGAADEMGLVKVGDILQPSGAGAARNLGVSHWEYDEQGVTRQMVALHTDVKVDIAGDLATVHVKQRFENPSALPLDATYLFPLHHDAAVYEMVMEVGAETIRGQIQREQQARETFAQGKREGKAVALLEQHRPNMFTQRVANLAPGFPIDVTISYVQTVEKVDGAYELVVPTVVGPRFTPAGTANPPPHHPATAVGGAGDDRLSIAVALTAGQPIFATQTAAHPLRVTGIGTSHMTATLAKGRVAADRDFVFRYRLAGSTSTAGLLAHRDQRGGFLSLLVEPPAAVVPEQIGAREMVFVLDCSGSMTGDPMAASKAFMRHALKRLRPTDSFRIIRFSDQATQFAASPIIASPENVARGLAYTDSLEGGGGTVMTSGIHQALGVPPPQGALRVVTFLTDGYIGNEAEVLQLIHSELGDARLYAFGVGTSVNRYLLDEMATVGRGFVRYLDPTDEIETVAADLAARLQSPVLTDIEVDWGDLEVQQVYPAKLPDLFAGQSVRVQARFDGTGRHEVKVKGQLRGHVYELPALVELPAETTPGREAVALVWARSAIAALLHRHEAVSLDPAERSGLETRITELGLAYALMTPWTSFVAVSEHTYTDPNASNEAVEVPLSVPRGTAMGLEGATFSGHGTPEPETWMLLLTALLGMILTWVAIRR